MIGSFRHKGLKRLYEQADKSGIRPDMLERVEDIPARLDVIEAPEEMNLPGYRLHGSLKRKTMPMKMPPHPGRSVRTACLEPLDLTVTAAARALGVTRVALSNVINGHAGISPEMAVRLAKAFGGAPETWLKMQLAYDLAQVSRQASLIKVKPVPQP